MHKFKTLYTFNFAQKKLVDDVTESTNEAGEKVTVTKKVEQDVPLDFCLQKPSRALIDDAELFYNVTVSKGIQAGLMSTALLAKRFSNDGGTISEEERVEWGNLFVERLKTDNAIQKLQVKQRTPEEEDEYVVLLKKSAALTRDMQIFEIRQQSLFDVTAEARARTRVIMWWMMFLLHKKNSADEWVPFFSGDSLEEKQLSYDDLDDEESWPDEEIRAFNAKVVSHALQAITLWYYGRIARQEQFKEYFDKQNEVNLALAGDVGTEEQAAKVEETGV